MIDMTRYIVRLVPIGAGALFLATGSVVAQTTGGQDIGDLAVNLRGQLGDIGTLVGGISALAGICLSMICLFKLKEYNKNPQDPQKSARQTNRCSSCRFLRTAEASTLT